MRQPETRTGTDNRIFHVGDQLEAEYRSRNAPVDCDLAIHHGYKDSTAMLYCKQHGIPVLVTEIGIWHNPGEFTYGIGYNGLNACAFMPDPPAEERARPELKPWRGDAGVTTIFGQKPGDAALRGLDIDNWVKSMLKAYPGSEFRQHPIMLEQPEQQETLEDCLGRTGLAVTYSSTVGAQALIEGITTYAEHPGSFAYKVEDREEWLHRLSWRMIDLGKPIPVDYILSGYEEARERAKAGKWDK